MDEARLAPNKKNAERDKATLIFVDESGFSLVPPVRRTWGRRGQPPVIHHRFNWPKLSAISGITVEGRLFLRLVRGTIRSAEIVKFFGVLLRHIRGVIIVVWDNAPTHRSQTVREWIARHPRMALEPLPAYACELNADEGVWEHLKGAPLGNYCAATLEELETRIHQCVRRLHKRKDVLRSFYQRTPLAKL